MHPAYFITGTDTGVGKTYIATKLLDSLSGEHGRAGYIKPFQTGCARDCGDRLVATDAEYVKEKLGERVECSVLTRYELSACPYHAAEAAGEEIDFGAACEWVSLEAGKFNASVIEGAGGLMVPITAEKTILDMIEAVGLDVIFVVANRLGCINHTLLSIKALDGRGINISAVVVNRIDAAEKDIVTESNARIIGQFAPRLRIIETTRGGDFKL